MIIPSKRKVLFRNYQQAVFYSGEKYSFKDRTYAFYLLLRPMLEFIKPKLLEVYEADEVESLLYILCINVFNKYDKDKSSIVPYLEKCLPWHIASLFKEINKEKELLLLPVEENYTINEEVYWQNILFCDRYVGKCFTRSEKYIISIIIESDEKELSVEDLAKKLNVKRHAMKRMLQNLKEVFKLEEIDVRS